MSLAVSHVFPVVKRTDTSVARNFMQMGEGSFASNFGTEIGGALANRFYNGRLPIGPDSSGFLRDYLRGLKVSVSARTRCNGYREPEDLGPISIHVLKAQLIQNFKNNDLNKLQDGQSKLLFSGFFNEPGYLTVAHSLNARFYKVADSPYIWVALNNFGGGDLPISGYGPVKPSIDHVKKTGETVKKLGSVVFNCSDRFLEAMFEYLLLPSQTNQFIDDFRDMQRELLANSKAIPASLGFLQDPEFFTERGKGNCCVQKSVMADLRLVVAEFVHARYADHPQRSDIGKHIFRILKHEILMDFKVGVAHLLKLNSPKDLLLQCKMDMKLNKLKLTISNPTFDPSILPDSFRQITTKLMGENVSVIKDETDRQRVMRHIQQYQTETGEAVVVIDIEGDKNRELQDIRDNRAVPGRSCMCTIS